MKRTLVTVIVVVAGFLAIAANQAQGQRRRSRPGRDRRAAPAPEKLTAEQKAEKLDRETQAVTKWLRENPEDGKKVIGSLIGEAVHARMEAFRKEMSKRHGKKFVSHSSDKLKEMTESFSTGAQRIRNWFKSNPERGKEIVAALWKEKITQAGKKMRQKFAQSRGHGSKAKRGEHKAGYDHAKADAKKGQANKRSRMRHDPWGRYPSGSAWGRGKPVTAGKKAPQGGRHEVFRKRMAEFRKRFAEARKAHESGKKPTPHKAVARPARRQSHHPAKHPEPVRTRPTRDSGDRNRRIDALEKKLDQLIKAAQSTQKELKELKK